VKRAASVKLLNMTSIEKQYWAGEFTDAEIDALAIDKAPALDRFAA
jgi:hypothetical protein